MRKMIEFAAFVQRTKQWKKFLFVLILNTVFTLNTSIDMLPFILLFNIIGSLFIVYVLDCWAATSILMNKIIDVVCMAEFADTDKQLNECREILQQLKVYSLENERMAVMAACMGMFASTEQLLNDLEEINGK